MSTNSDTRTPRADAIRNRRRALEAATALLAEHAAPVTVETIAKRAGMGAGTVVRAFGSKDALLDAAVSALLQPVVARGRELRADPGGERALGLFLAELMAFQAAHHGINTQLDNLDLPATGRLRAELSEILGALLDDARTAGAVRADIDPALTTVLLGETAFAIAKAAGSTPGLIEAFITVIMTGLHPRP